MSIKKPNNATEILDMVVSELTFIPVPEMRKAKGAFWARFQDNPICEPEEITQAVALRFGTDRRIQKWWSQEGFKEWFQNRDEFRQRMEYLAHLALDRLEAILADPRAQNSAQVNAAKLIMEVTRKMPSKAQAEYLDQKIAQMDRKQLEEYIRRNALSTPSIKSGPNIPEIPDSSDTN